MGIPAALLGHRRRLSPLPAASLLSTEATTQSPHRVDCSLDLTVGGNTRVVSVYTRRPLPRAPLSVISALPAFVQTDCAGPGPDSPLAHQAGPPYTHASSRLHTAKERATLGSHHAISKSSCNTSLAARTFCVLILLVSMSRIVRVSPPSALDVQHIALKSLLQFPYRSLPHHLLTHVSAHQRPAWMHPLTSTSISPRAPTPKSRTARDATYDMRISVDSVFPPASASRCRSPPSSWPWRYGRARNRPRRHPLPDVVHTVRTTQSSAPAGYTHPARYRRPARTRLPALEPGAHARRIASPPRGFIRANTPLRLSFPLHPRRRSSAHLVIPEPRLAVPASVSPNASSSGPASPPPGLALAPRFSHRRFRHIAISPHLRPIPAACTHPRIARQRSTSDARADDAPTQREGWDIGRGRRLGGRAADWEGGGVVQRRAAEVVLEIGSRDGDHLVHDLCLATRPRALVGLQRPACLYLRLDAPIRRPDIAIHQCPRPPRPTHARLVPATFSPRRFVIEWRRSPYARRRERKEGYVSPPRSTYLSRPRPPTAVGVEIPCLEIANLHTKEMVCVRVEMNEEYSSAFWAFTIDMSEEDARHLLPFPLAAFDTESVPSFPPSPLPASPLVLALSTSPSPVPSPSLSFPLSLLAPGSLSSPLTSPLPLPSFLPISPRTPRPTPLLRLPLLLPVPCPSSLPPSLCSPFVPPSPRPSLSFRLPSS
ncbi:hypothetical protein DFH06DRAFT_1328327 [Mycena polygramma]|nr:hypothetical protein DFH06DRAFT_1328327 [Mycena polygramma]